MDSSFWFDAINLWLCIVYTSGPVYWGRVDTEVIIFFRWRLIKIVFVIANSIDPDEMSHYAAFYLGLRCLPKNAFRSSQERVKVGTHDCPHPPPGEKKLFVQGTFDKIMSARRNVCLKGPLHSESSWNHTGNILQEILTIIKASRPLGNKETNAFTDGGYFRETTDKGQNFKGTREQRQGWEQGTYKIIFFILVGQWKKLLFFIKNIFFMGTREKDQ